ncbi:MAG: folate-binding protein YgfZ [Piscirickettsiaceae bacterium]|nr:folate-binding protein YgfZ [Piscirickettsiaceae bacterium]
MTHSQYQFFNEGSIRQDANVNTSNIIIPLTQLGVLEVKGEHSFSFLQNLLTNDVNHLDTNQAQPNGLCNAKGRLLATFILISRNNSLQLVLPKNMCTSIQQRLSMYKLRSKVVISDISNGLSIIGLALCSDTFNKNLLFPRRDYQAFEYESCLIIKIPSSINRYLCLGYQNDIDSLCQRFRMKKWQMSSEMEWQLLDINEGLATVLFNTMEKFTPQQINFDLIGGVSFNKGCYPGQEIVARLHYLGKPSRRLFSAQSTIKNLPDIGQNVTDLHGNILGHVIMGQFNSIHTVRLLLSLKLADCEKEMFVNKSTAVVKIQSLMTGAN